MRHAWLAVAETVKSHTSSSSTSRSNTLSSNTLNSNKISATSSHSASHLSQNTLSKNTANALKGGYIAIAALGGDEASSEKVGQFGASLAQFLKVPGNWQALVGGLSEADREKLAAAYIAGDGDTVGHIIGTQAASIPLAGAGAGASAKIAQMARAAGVEQAVVRVVGGVKLDARLPDPAAGLGYAPTVLDDANLNIANSHINGYAAELQLANEVAELPNQTVVKYGDKVGTNGADVISVNATTGEVTLWDSKYRSGSTTIEQSPTFTKPGPLKNALEEAEKEIRNAKLPPAIEQKALQNLDRGNYNTNTVGAGNARNSVPTRVCNHGAC